MGTTGSQLDLDPRSDGLPRQHPRLHSDEVGDSPMLLVNSDAELVPLALVQPMVDALEAAGVEHELLVLAGSRHSRAFSADVMDDTIAFFGERLAKD